MSALNSGMQKEQWQNSSQTVKRAGIDQLQQDIVKLIQQKYILTTEEEATALLTKYSATIRAAVIKSQPAVSLQTIPMMATAPTENFQRSTHFPKISSLSNEQKMEKVQNICLTNDTPVLYGCHNVVTNMRTVMSGSVMQLYGLNLGIDKSDTQQGLYLVDFAGRSFKITSLVRVKSTNIIFMIPSGIEAGVYKLEIRKRTCSPELIHTSLLQGFIRVVI